MKTAVKELYERLWETDKDKFTWIAILDDILEKEKEQIRGAFFRGSLSWATGESAEHYYKETYGEQ
jgi:hypothetical protein